MILNGNLDVKGTTKIKVLVDDSYVFNEDDIGLLVIQSGELYFNDGTELRRFTLDGFKSVLSSSLGFVLDDLSLNPSTLNALDNVSGMDGNSSLLDALTQLDSAIPTKFTSTYSSSTVHNITHNLNSQDIHVTLFNDSTNIVIDTSTIEVVDANNLRVTLANSQPLRVLVTAY